MTQCVVIYERAEDGSWGAYLPDLPGVVALDASRDEVATGIREALAAYVEEMVALRQQLPAPTSVAETLQAA